MCYLRALLKTNANRKTNVNFVKHVLKNNQFLNNLEIIDFNQHCFTSAIWLRILNICFIYYILPNKIDVKITISAQLKFYSQVCYLIIFECFYPCIKKLTLIQHVNKQRTFGNLHSVFVAGHRSLVNSQARTKALWDL